MQRSKKVGQFGHAVGEGAAETVFGDLPEGPSMQGSSQADVARMAQQSARYASRAQGTEAGRQETADRTQRAAENQLENVAFQQWKDRQCSLSGLGMAFKSPEEQRAQFDEERAQMRRFMEEGHAATLLSGLMPQSLMDIADGLFPSFGQADVRARSATAPGSSAAEQTASTEAEQQTPMTRFKVDPETGLMVQVFDELKGPEQSDEQSAEEEEERTDEAQPDEQEEASEDGEEEPSDSGGGGGDSQAALKEQKRRLETEIATIQGIIDFKMTNLVEIGENKRDTSGQKKERWRFQEARTS